MAKSVNGMIKTSTQVIPMIYAYTTPGVSYHDGYIKIGYTEQDVDTRIAQQTHTAGIMAKKEWAGNAVYEGTNETFFDKDFHAYLRKLGIQQPQDLGNVYFAEDDKNEWFFVSPVDSRNHFFDFRVNRGVVQNDLQIVLPYTLREEQTDAVNKTLGYRQEHEGGEYLWNAKPRFGKTLSVYDFIRHLGANRVLIVTNRPAIANSWYSDYEKFLGRTSGYFFVSKVDGIKEKPLVLSYEQYAQEYLRRKNDPSLVQMGLIEFVSLQDLKGASGHGGDHDKLQEVGNLEWDVLIIDEAHEGVDTYKTDVAFDAIKRKFTLHLSGTPFKAMATGKFPSNAIFNWTYADEQTKKRDWAGPGENPYAYLPKLNLFTYQMSEIIRDELVQGIDIDGDIHEYAFDLNEFFSTKDGKFIYEDSVDKFLTALTTQEKYPFSTPELRNELKHTFWLLDRVESAAALKKKLELHPVFREYKIVPAYGNAKADDAEATMKSYDMVVKAIQENDKTITLSVGQLTTGVTIPEWTAVMMLSNIKSPSLYMQAAFRAQNPCLFKTATGSYRKENAYVFDFAPERTLITFEKFANDLMQDTRAGLGDIGVRKQHVRDLLNFFPVIGEDDEGEMVELDTEQVLSIPRKIRAKEVVDSCFMSNFLFQNITNIFHAPDEILDILKQFTPAKEPAKNANIDSEEAQNMVFDDEDNVLPDEDMVINTTNGVLGSPMFANLLDTAKEAAKEAVNNATAKKTDEYEKIAATLAKQAAQASIGAVEQCYEGEMKISDKKKAAGIVQENTKRAIGKVFNQYSKEQHDIEKERQQALQATDGTKAQVEQVNKTYDQKQAEAKKTLQTNIDQTLADSITTGAQDTVTVVETRKAEQKKDEISEQIRDHLRGFSRTIPSFIMAYGDENLKLANFDTYVSDQVFKDVTGITLDQFRLLRDGGDITNPTTQQPEKFEGHLFDEVVFDDSIKEFLRKREELADYFADHEEDIFTYIPPQKTNQIFTPRWVVNLMLDKLEEENPGCFDNPDATFADLYVKSGLYIAETVKRLYRSEMISMIYPDPQDRIKHILEHQVFGMAPTEIIWRIATRYIFGFDKNGAISQKNIVLADTAEAAKNGTLDELIDKTFKKPPGIPGPLGPG